MPDYGHEGRGRRGVTMPKGPKGPGPGNAPQSKVEWGCAQPGVIVPCPTKESAQLRAASKFGGVVVSRTVTPWKES